MITHQTITLTLVLSQKNKTKYNHTNDGKKYEKLSL